jgi:divalent metal cation (Fe/Co/Zn/Cd) transporter
MEGDIMSFAAAFGTIGAWTDAGISWFESLPWYLQVFGFIIAFTIIYYLSQFIPRGETRVE